MKRMKNGIESIYSQFNNNYIVNLSNNLYNFREQNKNIKILYKLQSSYLLID